MKLKLKEGLTRNVVLLGVVSGLTDISSEMLYPLVPLFLTVTLHAPMSVVGVIEGAAEATASLIKIAGGWWSDKMGKRKPFVVWGYGLSSVAKPLMALAFAWPAALAARVVDRVGKGLRTSARDALVAASTPKEHWGKAFGFHRAMDTAGAALGPLAALLLLNLGLSYRKIFVIAFIPAVIGVIVLAKAVREVPPPAPAKNRFAGGLGGPCGEFRPFTVCYAVFALGNSSDIFLLLKAKNSGFSTTHMILAYAGYNVVYALFAGPAGWLSDRLGKIKTIVFGFAVFAGVYAGFAFASSSAAIWALFAAYGFYGAFTEGVAKAIVADLSAPESRATAMGVFQGAAGLLAFAASSLAGFLWTYVSPSAPFALGAVCAAASALLLAATFRNLRAECRSL